MIIQISSLSELVITILSLLLNLLFVIIIHECSHILMYVILERNKRFKVSINWKKGIHFYYNSKSTIHTLFISLAGGLGNIFTAMIALLILSESHFFIQLSYLSAFINFLPFVDDGKAIFKSVQKLIRP